MKFGIWNAECGMRSKYILLITCYLLLAISPLFAELTLKDAIEMATQNNKDLLMAKEDVEIAKYNYNDIRGQLFPQLTLVGSYSLTRNQMPPNVLGSAPDFTGGLKDHDEPNNDEYLAGLMSGLVGRMMPDKVSEESSLVGQLQFRQLLFSGGKLINGLRVLDKVKTLQSKRYELQYQNMIVTVINAYYDLYLAQEGLAIQRQALENAERHLARVENLHNQGLVSEYDKLRAELEVSRLRPEILNFENMKNLAEENFNRITGNTGEVVLNPTLTAKTELFSDFQIDLDDAIATAQEQRIELYLINLTTEMYEVQHNAEKSNFLPNVILQADLTKYNVSDYTIHKNDFGTMWSAGIALQMPLFTGLSNSSKTSRARHELRKAQHDASNTAELIHLEIRQNWQSFNQSLRYLETQERNLALAERALDIATTRFESQYGIQLEVFDAQIQYNAAQIALSQAKVKIIKDYFALNKSLGNDLNTIIGEI